MTRIIQSGELLLVRIRLRIMNAVVPKAKNTLNTLNAEFINIYLLFSQSTMMI